MILLPMFCLYIVYISYSYFLYCCNTVIVIVKFILCCTFTLLNFPNIMCVKASVKIDCLKSTEDLVDSLIKPVTSNLIIVIVNMVMY